MNLAHRRRLCWLCAGSLLAASCAPEERGAATGWGIEGDGGGETRADAEVGGDAEGDAEGDASDAGVDADAPPPAPMCREGWLEPTEGFEALEGGEYRRVFPVHEGGCGLYQASLYALPVPSPRGGVASWQARFKASICNRCPRPQRALMGGMVPHLPGLGLEGNLYDFEMGYEGERALVAPLPVLRTPGSRRYPVECFDRFTDAAEILGIFEAVLAPGEAVRLNEELNWINGRYLPEKDFKWGGLKYGRILDNLSVWLEVALVPPSNPRPPPLPYWESPIDPEGELHADLAWPALSAADAPVEEAGIFSLPGLCRLHEFRYLHRVGDRPYEHLEGAFETQDIGPLLLPEEVDASVKGVFRP